MDGSGAFARPLTFGKWLQRGYKILKRPITVATWRVAYDSLVVSLCRLLSSSASPRPKIQRQVSSLDWREKAGSRNSGF